MTMLPLKAVRVSGLTGEVSWVGMAVVSFSLIRDGECTGAREHCGRADAAYGKVC